MSTEGREVSVDVDIVNEQVVLGAAIAGWDDGTIDKLLATFGADHFLSPEHAAVWKVLRAMRQRKLAWDLATFRQQGGDAAGVRLLSEIADARPDVPPNLDHHIEAMLWDRSRTTALQGPISALIDALRDSHTDRERVQALARQVQTSLNAGDRKHLFDSAELVRSQMTAIENRASGIAYPFGIDGLDYYEDLDSARSAGIVNAADLADDEGRVRRMLPGAEPGYITLVSSMTGGGKSALGAALTLGMARQKRRVLYCAWEPKAGMTLEALACQSLGWSRARLMAPTPRTRLTDEEKETFRKRMESIAKYVRFMSKGPFYERGRKRNRSNEENLDIFASYIADSGCDAVVVDPWKYVLCKTKPEDEEAALAQQQAMVEDLNIHMVMLHQQTHKRTEMREDKRPSREGIKGSGAYLEIADNCICPYIPSLFKPGIPADRFEVYVLKQRYWRWPIGVEFDWEADIGRITGGRTIPYDLHSGNGGSSGDDFNDFVKPKPNKGGARGARR